MTHTLNGNSGIGDFGREGINAFIRDHQCGEICKCLCLNENVPLDILEEDDGEVAGTTGRDKGSKDANDNLSSDTEDEDGDLS